MIEEHLFEVRRGEIRQIIRCPEVLVQYALHPGQQLHLARASLRDARRKSATKGVEMALGVAHSLAAAQRQEQETEPMKTQVQMLSEENTRLRKLLRDVVARLEDATELIDDVLGEGSK